jgi:hypothetical protein
MKPSSLLLRVLLSLALVVNGIGAAMAGAQMVGSAVATPADAHAAAAPAGAHAGCHAHAAVATPDGGKLPSGHPGPDCCEQGLCDCHCAQLAPLAFVAPMPASAAVAPILAPWALHPSHESPRLAHLIRPPISQAT